jgi:hypothetical protein
MDGHRADQTRIAQQCCTVLPNESLQPTGAGMHQHRRAFTIATRPGFPNIEMPPAAELGC